MKRDSLQAEKGSGNELLSLSDLFFPDSFPGIREFFSVTPVSAWAAYYLQAMSGCLSASLR